MAGIRGDVVSITTPRGFPNDASFTTRLEYEHDGLDAHTPSWLTAQEATEICEWYDYTPFVFSWGTAARK